MGMSGAERPAPHGELPLYQPGAGRRNGDSVGTVQLTAEVLFVVKQTQHNNQGPFDTIDHEVAGLLHDPKLRASPSPAEVQGIRQHSIGQAAKLSRFRSSGISFEIAQRLSDEPPIPKLSVQPESLDRPA